MNKIIYTTRNVQLTTNKLLLITSSYIALILNSPFLFRSLKVVTELEQYNLFFLISLPILLLSLTIVLQGLLSFRWVTKPFLIFTVMSSSLIFYATTTYGIIFDYGMVQNTVETDPAEAFSYLNLYAVLFVLLFGVVPSLFIYFVPLTYEPFFYELLSRLKLLTFSSVIVIFICITFYSNYFFLTSRLPNQLHELIKNPLQQ